MLIFFQTHNPTPTPPNINPGGDTAHMIIMNARIIIDVTYLFGVLYRSDIVL
jgi:hypothetical protein